MEEVRGFKWWVMGMGMLIGLGVVVNVWVWWPREKIVRVVEEKVEKGSVAGVIDGEDELAGWSAEQKVGQLFSVAINASVSAELITVVKPGMVGLFGTEEMSREEVGELIEKLRQVNAASGGERLLAWVDQEGGRVQRLAGDGFSDIPDWEEVCEEFEPIEVRELGRKVGEELMDVGVDGVWGPVVDRTNEESRVLRGRTCSEEPEKIVSYAKALIEGYHQAGLMAVVKHYPGLGAISEDPHVELGVVEKVDVEVFELLMKLMDGVMVTHVGLGEGKLPCTISGMCVGDLVRLRNGKNSLVFSDAMEMEGLTRTLGDEEAVYQAIMAGVEVLVYGAEASMERQIGVYNQLVDLYSEDQHFGERVDSAVKRILEVKRQHAKILELR